MRRPCLTQRHRGEEGKEMGEEGWEAGSQPRAERSCQCLLWAGCWPGSQGAEPHRSVKSTPANQRLQLQVQLQPLLVPKARQLLNWALVVPLGC